MVALWGVLASSLLIVLPIICNCAPEWEFKPVGRITLMSSTNTGLCIRTEQLDRKSSILKLALCDKQYPAYKGEKVFEQGEVNQNDFQLRTMHVPTGSDFGIFACLFTVNVNVPVYTEKCDKDNVWHHWTLRKVQENVQLVHKKTGKCIRAPAIADGIEVLSAECNESDANQLWKLKKFED